MNPHSAEPSKLSRLNLRLPTPEELKQPTQAQLSHTEESESDIEMTGSFHEQAGTSTKRTAPVKKVKKRKAGSQKNSPYRASNSRSFLSPQRKKSSAKANVQSLNRLKRLVAQCSNNVLRTLEKLDDIDTKLLILQHRDGFV